MPIRQTAKITGHQSEPKVRHYRGLPPELARDNDQRELLEPPVLISIEEKPDGVFLFRFTADGTVVGDTWHMTVEDAKHQAGIEFGDFLSDWKTVPDDVVDLVSFGLDPE